MAEDRPIIVIKKKGHHGGHHGGAWKVAYADFVTAMMAFFMVMWLLNTAEVRVKKAVASYFRKQGIFEHGSPYPIDKGHGAGIFSDTFSPSKADESEKKWQLRKRLPTLQEEIEKELRDKARMKGLSDIKPRDNIKDAVLITEANEEAGNSTKGVEKRHDEGSYTTPFDKRGGPIKEVRVEKNGVTKPVEAVPDQTETFNDVQIEFKEQLEHKVLAGKISAQVNAIAASGELGQVKVTLTSDGIELEIMDTKEKSMFDKGSSRIAPSAESAFAKISEVVNPLPYGIEITGHTDGSQFLSARGYSNWELSADRAQAARRFMTQLVKEERIISVNGRADRDLKVVEDPLNPSNRRISIKLNFNHVFKPDGTVEKPGPENSAQNIPPPTEKTNPDLNDKKAGSVSPKQDSPATSAAEGQKVATPDLDLKIKGPKAEDVVDEERLKRLKKANSVKPEDYNLQDPAQLLKYSRNRSQLPLSEIPENPDNLSESSGESQQKTPMSQPIYREEALKFDPVFRPDMMW